MNPVYWTKRASKVENNEVVYLDEFEIIKEELELGFVPDGDGFEVNMNEISYEDYLANPEAYELINGTLNIK